MRKRKLTYGGNHAIINGKNGAVVGGTVYFQSGPADNAKIIFQIKSGGVGRGDIANLHRQSASPICTATCWARGQSWPSS